MLSRRKRGRAKAEKIEFQILDKNALYLWKVISTKINKVGKKWLDGVTETNSHFDDFYIFFS